MLPSLDFSSRLLSTEDLSLGVTTIADGSAIESEPVHGRNPGYGVSPRTSPRGSVNAQHQMRFTKPTPFQESRNFWRKSIAAQQGRTESAEQPLSPSKRSHSIGCTKRPSSIDSIVSGTLASSDGDNDSSLCPQRFCRPSAIPVWQKSARHRHSNPTMRLAGPKSPKRRTPTRIVGGSEYNISPKRALMPRRVQSRGRLSFLRGSESDSKASEDLAGVGVNEILVKMEVEVYNETAQPEEDPATESNMAAQNLWNDPAEQHKFTTTWRDHQDGNITKDTFLGQLDFEPSTENTSRLQQKRIMPTKIPAVDASSKIQTTPNNAAPTSIPAAVPPTPPTRRSSKDKGIHEAKSLCMTRIRSRHELEGISEDQKLEQEGEECQSALQLSTIKPSNKMSSSIPVLSASNSNLKSARSVESISQIEAMITPKPIVSVDLNAQSRGAQKKAASRRPSKTLQPASHPPERPLPELPVDVEDTKSRCRMSNASEKNTDSSGCDTDTFGSSPQSVSTVEVPSPMTPTNENHISDQSSTKTLAGLSIELRTTIDDAPATPIVDHLDSSVFSDDCSPITRLRSKPSKKIVLTDRTEKVRELKKKHIAALARGRARSSKKTLESNATKSPEGSPNTRRVSRCTQTIETIAGSPLFFPPPPPPPFTIPSKRQSIFGTPPKAKRESMDELDQFPRVPLSRPGSRASVTPTIHSSKGTTRTGSPARKSRSRARTLQGRHSLNQDGKQLNRQPLSHSVIYINVDTDPVSCNFRASAISRSPSRTRRGRQPSSPRKVVVDTTSAGTDDKSNLSPKADALKQKQSSRSLRSQASIARTVARHGLERVSPVSVSRPGSKHNPGLLSSDEDSENVDFIPKRVSSARPGSKSSNISRASRKRKDRAVVPQLPMTGQFAMEHVLMALAKCQNQGLDISLLSSVDVEKLAHQQKMEDELDSRAAKRMSVVQRPQRPLSGRFDEPSRLLKVNMKLPRPASDMSILTMAGTDTDASTHRMSDGYSSTGKRGSAGSLTDPTDVETYDLKPAIQPLQANGANRNSRLIRTRRRPSSPTLSMKSFSYYQAHNNLRQPTIVKRASLMLMTPPVAPPRTTSRSQTDPLSSAVSQISKSESEQPLANYHEVLDLEETGTSDPFMLGMLDGMATWSNPVVDENVWRTWGDHKRVIEGKALFEPTPSGMARVCV